MSVQATTWVWDSATAEGNTLLVLLAIADAANREGEMSCQSVPTLVKMSRLSESTVYRCLKYLRETGAIEKTGLHPRYHTAIYRLPQMGTPVNLTGSHSETPVTGDTGTPVTADSGPLSAVTPNPKEPTPEDSPHPVESGSGEQTRETGVIVRLDPATHPSRPLSNDWAPRPHFARWLMGQYDMSWEEVRESGRRFTAHHVAKGDTARSWEALLMKWVSTDAERFKGPRAGTDDRGIPYSQHAASLAGLQPGDEGYVDPQELIQTGLAAARQHDV